MSSFIAYIIWISVSLHTFKFNFEKFWSYISYSTWFISDWELLLSNSNCNTVKKDEFDILFEFRRIFSHPPKLIYVEFGSMIELIGLMIIV